MGARTFLSAALACAALAAAHAAFPSAGAPPSGGGAEALCPGGVCPLPADFPFPPDSAEDGTRLEDFEVVRTLAGDPGPRAFEAFLRGGGEPAEGESAFEAAMRRGGAPLLALALLVAGLLLNLTPCTLPLVPVNLAILSIGAGRATRARGAAVGAAFGAGMAASYGALGLAAAGTGRTFGAINGSAAFALAVGAAFAAMALAAAGVLRVDFSSLRNRLPRPGGRPGKAAGGPAGAERARGGVSAARLSAAFAAGAGSAALAGACVAPALVSALVLTADLTGRGVRAGALVPFALGLGMGLPWPFLGAGLAALPKPGRWTGRVKAVFAAVFAVAACAYFARAWRIAGHGGRSGDGPASGEIAWLRDEKAATAAAEKSGKPLLVDFTAGWCGVCRKMETGTFADPAVRAAIGEIHGPALLRIDCTDMSDPRVRELLERFSAPGLPFFAILRK